MDDTINKVKPSSRRILFIIDSLGVGGAEKSLLSLLSLLDKQRYQLCIWILHRGGQLEQFIPDGVEVMKQPSYSIIDKVFNSISHYLYAIVYRFQSLVGIKRHLSETLWRCSGWAMKVPKGEFDVVVAYQQGIPTYLLHKVNARKRIAWDNVNMKNAGYDMHFNEYFYVEIDKIVTVSQELLTLMLNAYPSLKDKLVCVYDILSPLLIHQQAMKDVDVIRDKKGITILATVGRLVPQKQMALAVEAAYRLRLKGLFFRWYIIGEGSERLKLQNLIQQYKLEDEVILTGMLTNPYPYMANCDIYVQTSAFEGYGLTIAEAKILGKPIVSTNFDVVHDQLEHEVNGLIADMNAESVAECIFRLATDNVLRQRIVDNVLKEENTTAITEINKVEALFDED